MADSLDNISTDAAAPKSATTAAGSASQHSLKDRLEVERAKTGDANLTATSSKLPIRIGRFIPPGTV